MAITITPGYTFGVNEVPNQITIKLMLDAIEFSGIPKSLISSDLIGELHGMLTSASMVTLPSQGWLLHTDWGALFAMTTKGPVSIYHTGKGGYETVRYPQGAPTDSLTHPLTANATTSQLVTKVEAELSDAEVYWQGGRTNVKVQNCMQSATTVSGANTRMIMCGISRGQVLTAARGSQAFEYVARKTSATDDWNPAIFPAFNGDTEGLGAKIAIVGPEEGNLSRAPVYLFGLEHQQQ